MKPTNNTAKNVLYISYDGMTDPLGQAQVLPYLAGLSKMGFRFFILSFEKKERLEKERWIIEKICAETGITWIPLPFHKNPPILSKAYDRMIMKREARRQHAKHKFSIVHCRSYPASEVGMYLKRRFGVKFIFDVRGFWPEEKVDSGQWDTSKAFYRWLYRFYKEKEKQFILNADQIIPQTWAGKNELLKFYTNVYQQFAQQKEGQGVRTLNDKITVIPCCADLEHFDYRKITETDQEALRQKLGLSKDQKILSYSGTLGTWYMMDEMLDFFTLFQKRYSGAVFLCLTKDPAIMELHLQKKNIDRGSVILTYVSRPELPLYLSLSYCSIFFIRPTYSKISASPVKHAELMGMGIPVVCNAFGDIGTIVPETGTGVVVEGFADEAYKKALNELEQLTITPAMIREAARQYFDLQGGTELYKKVYHSII